MDYLIKLIEVQKDFAQYQKKFFFQETLFSYQWWIILATTIILWVVWVLVVDKKRLKSIMIVGLITSLMATVMDDIGLSLAAWHYPYQLVYFTTRFNPVDLAVIPVTYMLLYQYFVSWRSFFIAILSFCLFAAFIAEPIFVLLDMYIMMRWEYWYSAPIYFAMGILVKWLMDKLDAHSA
ncbi:CBO0543 family protein [Rossellomorea marisflavi]|uniref:CBO0543 family protein n=1 Tax=Rossellomorea marisflavi TaxID=189381 RepID=UPI0028531FAC|nr:CBO0543 family protein [Rossellomorea marisflavi]MDR4938261.1 CBO0543 family protein [Rossellomorea marisflavi]